MGGSNTKLGIDVRLDGKTAIVTGSNTGIGKVTARELYKRGAKVIMACRDLKKAEAAADEIKSQSANENCGAIVIMELDLSDLNSVRKCAEEILSSEEFIHLLINNAGVAACPRMLTKDGFELQFGTNHLGHFLFTNLLLQKIINSSPARIVNVSSIAHQMGTILWDDLNYEKSYSSFGAYSQSKLANVLFSLELSKRLEGTGVTTYSLHPGVVKTEIDRHMDAVFFTGVRAIVRAMVSLMGKTPETGCLTTLYCALNEKAGTETGLYYSDCKVTQTSALGRDEEQAKKLWDVSSRLVKLDNENN